MNNSVALYSYFRSSASYRVRIALGLKKIQYEYRAVHLLNEGGEQLRDVYRKLNPSAQVPTLVHNGQAIGQSMAIIDYLDAIQPEPRLFSAEPLKRAQMIQACEIVNSGIQPLHNLSVLSELEKRFNASSDGKREWTVHWIERGLLVLEDFLQAHAGDFCFGNQPTAVDCFAIPHLANADRFKVSLENSPTLSRIRTNCEKLEAFRSAGIAVQPDTPANFNG